MGILDELKGIKETIAAGHNHFRDYEHQIRVTVNFLFLGDLSEAKAQVRTEPGSGGIEIRDLICQNRADSGFWKDLKEKYSCTEILFDPKNTEELTREDLKDVYSYLKPAIGLWGFIVCRKTPSTNTLAYNRTLFNNNKQERGVLILTDDDLLRMVNMKLQGNDPAEYVRDRMSEFIRGI
jgi:ADP-ribose pyrophosphatase YjhB (NUDIX family)